LHSCYTVYETLDEVGYEPPPDAEGGFGGAAAAGTGDPCSNTSGSMLHHTMEEGHRLGDETFQLRAVAVRSSSDSAANLIVRRFPMVIRGQRPNTTFSDAASVVSKTFVAQAEYYYDTTYDQKAKGPAEPQEDWLWNMKWRARLRRVRFSLENEQKGNAAQSGSVQPQSTGAACKEFGTSVQDPAAEALLGGAQELLEGLMVH